MTVYSPTKFRSRSPRKHSVEAMQFRGSNTEAMAVYQWIEQNTAGSFDVNSPDDPIPNSGVSIDAATGHMVIANDGEIQDVELGDWVVQLANGKFTAFKSRDFWDTYTSIS